MSERPAKRLRRLSIDDADSEGTDEWESQALTMARRTASGTQPGMAPRTRRGASAEPQKRSIRLTVKAPPSRLQEIKGDEDEVHARPSRARAGRTRNLRQSYVDKGSSAEEEDDEEDAEGDADDQDEDEDEEGDEEDDEEEEDAEGDVEMEDAPPPPKPSKPTNTIRFSASSSSKPSKARKASPSTTINLGSNKHRTVEEKETGDAASQSESSEVEDDPEDLENGALDEPDGADRGDTIKVDAINESDLDSEDSNDSSLPDLSKLTRRQRGGFEDGSLMALSNEAQKKKFFTAEQITMRRAEMARRRKDLSEKRNEQEKADTLRRLLEKPAPTRRSRAQVLADAEREEFGPGRAGLRGDSVMGDEEEGEPEVKANRIYARTIVGKNGTNVGIPLDWLDAPAGALFEKSQKGEGWSQLVRSGRMVEEVQ